MATEVKIPIPDQTTEQVRIVNWHKAPGDAVQKGEIVLEVESDKSVIEVEAVGAGVLLQQLFAEDDMVPVGKVVALIGEPSEPATPATVPGKSAQAAPTAPAAVTVPAAGPQVKASPVAKKIAEKLGVDLNLITGTGPNGRITSADVETFAAAPAATPVRPAGGRIIASPNAKRLSERLNVDLTLVAGTGPSGRIVGTDVEKFAASAPASATDIATAAPAAAPTAPANGQPKPGTEVALSKMRRAIGTNLQRSAQERPHFNVTMSIDMTRALDVRSKINQGREKPQRISVNDLIVRACALALQQYPAVNSRLYEDRIAYLPDINIGIATAIAEGLVVPVLSNTDQKSWDELAAESKRLAQQARTGKIIGAGKGTFTVSNLGMFGVDNFTAIINPPEAAILAVGAVKNEVVDIGGGIGIRPIMTLILCSDHRVVDGALAAEFLRSIKLYLEEQITQTG